MFITYSVLGEACRGFWLEDLREIEDLEHVDVDGNNMDGSARNRMGCAYWTDIA